METLLPLIAALILLLALEVQDASRRARRRADGRIKLE